MGSRTKLPVSIAQLGHFLCCLWTGNLTWGQGTPGPSAPPLRICAWPWLPQLQDGNKDSARFRIALWVKLCKVLQLCLTHSEWPTIGKWHLHYGLICLLKQLRSLEIPRASLAQCQREKATGMGNRTPGLWFQPHHHQALWAQTSHTRFPSPKLLVY